MRIAFLSSIYPAHAEKIYRENPSLKKKSSEEQMEFIRWHALSSFVRWFELLEQMGFATCVFNHNLPEVALAWARENKFKPKSCDSIIEIGLEKIKRFKPDVIFAFAPLTYLKNNFLDELISSLSKRPKVIAWYGANCGDEEIFRYFDLTLSNSKHLVNSLKEKGIKADFLQHAFDPIILEKIKIPKNRLNRVAFFGNLDVSTIDFRERTKLLEEVSEKTNLLDIYGAHNTPSLKETAKHSLLITRQKISHTLNKFAPNQKFDYWSNKQNMPPSPWELSKNFCKKIKSPLYGQEMLQKLSSYQIALNYHNRHTGDFACNMRLFEATGLGCALITDHKSDLHEYFDLEREVLTYKTPEELCSKIKFLINNTEVADEMGLEAQAKCLSNYNIFNLSDIFCDYIQKL
ncbi:glycosyltransferase [Opitutales bacterium]|nr:glycosyltransferase [Opitutales bacterium]